MTAEQMNSLYLAYQLDPTALEPLLVAVRRRAVIVMRDEDAAQEFTIGVWQAFPLAPGENFSAWINVRLRHRNLDWIRDNAAPGEMVELDVWEQYGAKRKDARSEWLRVVDIEDPFIRSVAALFNYGYTQAECAEILKINPSTLKMRLQRYRKNIKKVAA